MLTAGSALAQLELSEMLADPASDWDGNGEVHSRDDEWLEVTNNGTDPVDLSAYYVRDALGEEAQLNLTGMLNAGEAAVFYGSDAVAWQQEHGVSVTGLSLNNSGDTIELWLGDPTLPESDLVNVHIYLDHEAEDDRASGRLHILGEWALFDGLNPYEGTTEPLGTGCEPSPGVVNDCQPQTPLEEASWGHLKADYR
jgi:hypothetical protein